MKIELKLGELKKKLTTKERIEKIVSESDMKIDFDEDWIWIRISGPAANLPSMKNSKLPGKNFAAPDFLGRVKSLDSLWNSQIDFKAVPRFGLGVRVGLLIISAKRTRSFDPIGCLETVQDWLEPKNKKVGRKGTSRGWGIGLIDNDSQVVGISLRYDEHHRELFDPESTHILIKPFEKISREFSDFLLNFF
jgi:hypothetical protein